MSKFFQILIKINKENACYLIAQNGDTRKKVIALAQTYFAIQTRKQEISEKDYISLTEDKKILSKKFNKKRKLFT